MWKKGSEKRNVPKAKEQEGRKKWWCIHACPACCIKGISSPCSCAYYALFLSVRKKTPPCNYGQRRRWDWPISLVLLMILVVEVVPSKLVKVVSLYPRMWLSTESKVVNCIQKGRACRFMWWATKGLKRGRGSMDLYRRGKKRRGHTFSLSHGCKCVWVSGVGCVDVRVWRCWKKGFFVSVWEKRTRSEDEWVSEWVKYKKKRNGRTRTDRFIWEGHVIIFHSLSQLGNRYHPSRCFSSLRFIGHGGAEQRGCSMIVLEGSWGFLGLLGGSLLLLLLSSLLLSLPRHEPARETPAW